MWTLLTSYKRLKSRIGKFFAGAYLCFVVLGIFSLFVAAHDGLSALFLLLYAGMPWGLILMWAVFEIAPEQSVGTLGGIALMVLYAFCIFLNAATYYFLGSLLGRLLSWLAADDHQNENDSKTPQD